MVFTGRRLLLPPPHPAPKGLTEEFSGPFCKEPGFYLTGPWTEGLQHLMRPKSPALGSLCGRNHFLSSLFRPFMQKRAWLKAWSS